MISIENSSVCLITSMTNQEFQNAFQTDNPINLSFLLLLPSSAMRWQHRVIL
jgi:hypothetical protein